VTLLEFQKKHFTSRALCAEAFGVTSQQISKWVFQNRDVEQLADGRWLIINKYRNVTSTSIDQIS